MLDVPKRVKCFGGPLDRQFVENPRPVPYFVYHKFEAPLIMVFDPNHIDLSAIQAYEQFVYGLKVFVLNRRGKRRIFFRHHVKETGNG